MCEHKLKILIITFIVTICFVQVSGGFLEQDQCYLDVNDILNEDLMPGSLSLLGDIDLMKNNISEGTLENRMMDVNDNDLDNGGWDQAYNTMGYHR